MREDLHTIACDSALNFRLHCFGRFTHIEIHYRLEILAVHRQSAQSCTLIFPTYVYVRFFCTQYVPT